MSSLQDVFTVLPPGYVADPTGLDALLAGCWDTFNGSDGGGMEGYKLLGRMEDVAWTPPVLSFVLERHGGTVCGSSRAELQHWAVDLDARTATITRSGHRQLKPMAPRLSIKAIADEVAQAILDGKEDDRLHWIDVNTVRVQTSSIFPSGSGYKRTVEGRRKTLCGYIENRLAGNGWQRQGRNQFIRESVEAGNDAEVASPDCKFWTETSKGVKPWNLN